MNIQYIRTDEIKYSYSIIEYSGPNNWINTKYQSNPSRICTEYTFMKSKWLNMNIEHSIRILNIRVMIFEYSNNQIYLCYTDCSIEILKVTGILDTISLKPNKS
jgi:hypothetical protein